ELDDTCPREVCIVYDEIKTDEGDVVLAYSTDSRFVAYGVKLLEDDKVFFPPYDAVTTIRQETLDEYPEIEEAIELLIGAFDEDLIGELNGKVDLDKEDIQEVAIDYLKSQDLIE